MQLDFNELRELLATLNQTDITELTLKSGEFELKVRKGGGGEAAGATVVAPAPTVGVDFGSLVATPPAVPQSSPATDERQSATAGGASGISPPAMETKYETISSPMVGTFYRAVSPGEPPFVEVGDRISSGQAVCIIEAFKVMNEVEAEISGEIIEILVENGESVEFDQPLMRVKPS
ncbi:MAG: acetyl-CoA carboxylase biotin carboxyl carrier protein [Cyanobacteriota bacterium]|nr:acetyl-CoA carboxylase biotin carboxyl carrier protein [Cyanobacteriota bacterium]